MELVKYNSGISPNRRESARFLRQLACLVIFLLAIGALSIAKLSALEGPTEHQVEAAFLFNFFKFVEWPNRVPTNANDRWVIGIVGDNPFGDELAQIVSGKSVQGHELLIKRYQTGEDLASCHLLFISASEKKRLPSILASLRGSGVLTVADMDHFIESGGMIQFVTEDNRVRFSIDVGATGRAHLKVSSKLLSLARAVTETAPVGTY